MSTLFQRARHCVLALLALFAVQSASAITPESGFWWVKNQPGSGIAIDITDNWLFMATYVYDFNGDPIWYTAFDTMSDDHTFHGQLIFSEDGQPLGGPWRDPLRSLLVVPNGNVSIFFDQNDETKATIVWAGGTQQLERTDMFELVHGRANFIHQAQRMRGEWTLVADLFSRPGSEAFPYIGDVLIFDSLDASAAPPIFYDGCRPISSLDGFCPQPLSRLHPAAGFYSPATNEHVFVVTDSAGANANQDVFFSYTVSAGLNQFDGVLQIYVGPNGFNPNGPFYPVRGFRSASRAFVDTGVGPNALTPDAKAAAPASRPSRSQFQALLDANGGQLPAGLSAAEVKQRFGIDTRQSKAAIDQLSARLQR